MILSKRIFDKDSQQPLYQRNFKTGESVFLRHAQTAKLPQNPNSYIKYEVVMKAIKKAVQEEMRQAKRVRLHLQAGEGEDLKRQKLEDYSRQAEAIFQKMTQIEKGRVPLYEEWMNGKIDDSTYQGRKEKLREELAQQDKEFQAVMEDVTKLEGRYSEKNKWLETFQEPKLLNGLNDLKKLNQSNNPNNPNNVNDVTLTLADIKRWVEKVEVRDFQQVFVSMTQVEEKQVFPEEWLVEGDVISHDNDNSNRR